MPFFGEKSKDPHEKSGAVTVYRPRVPALPAKDSARELAIERIDPRRHVTLRETSAAAVWTEEVLVVKFMCASADFPSSESRLLLFRQQGQEPWRLASVDAEAALADAKRLGVSLIPKKKGLLPDATSWAGFCCPTCAIGQRTVGRWVFTTVTCRCGITYCSSSSNLIHGSSVVTSYCPSCRTCGPFSGYGTSMAMTLLARGTR